MVRDRQEEIRSKGFNIVDTRYKQGYEGPLDYNSIKVGMKKLEDAVLNLGSLRRIPNRGLGDKCVVLRAIAERNLPLMRSISIIQVEFIQEFVIILLLCIDMIGM